MQDKDSIMYHHRTWPPPGFAQRHGPYVSQSWTEAIPGEELGSVSSIIFVLRWSPANLVLALQTFCLPVLGQDVIRKVPCGESYAALQHRSFQETGHLERPHVSLERIAGHMGREGMEGKEEARRE